MLEEAQAAFAGPVDIAEDLETYDIWRSATWGPSGIPDVAVAAMFVRRRVRPPDGQFVVSRAAASAERMAARQSKAWSEWTSPLRVTKKIGG